jgi:hypothetical protein
LFGLVSVPYGIGMVLLLFGSLSNNEASHGLSNAKQCLPRLSAVVGFVDRFNKSADFTGLPDGQQSRRLLFGVVVV